MRRKHRILTATLVAITFASLLPLQTRTYAQTDTAIAPSLVISQFKITSSNGQYITLYNQTGTATDLSKYQLEYFNNYDLAKASSSKLIGLTGVVPPHGYAMVNDGNLTLCYQLTVDSVSLGLSSTAGFLELIAYDQSLTNGQLGESVQDFVGWSKTAAAGAQTLPASTAASLQRLPLDGGGNPSLANAGSGSWRQVQPDVNNPCALTTVATSGAPSVPAASGLSQLLPTVQPDATFVASDSGQTTQSASPGIPAGDIGLMAPTITEMLPNPVGTGTDADGEFIELYNPNPTGFDMAGFKLQSGLASLHSYVFPSGILLEPQSYTAFYTSGTGLSQSNTSGQAALFDPLGNQLSQTDPYSVAADGQAWAQASGTWQWTTVPTPGEANKIAKPAPKASSRKTSTKTSTTSKTKKASAAAKSSGKALSSASAFSDAPPKTPIHPAVLALVAALALLYAGYEYRKDLGNYLYRFRTYLSARRGNRPTGAGR